MESFIRTNRDSVGIQTQNLLIRSQVLYSVELRNHFVTLFLNCECKGIMFFGHYQIFSELFITYFDL